MSFDPALADAVSRVRFLVGDITADWLEDDTYTALLAAANGDEGVAAAQAAGALLIREPVKESDNGTSADRSNLMARWQAIVAQQTQITAQAAGGMASRQPRRGDQRRAGGEYCREPRW